jgi:hypothetical protein
MNQKRRSLTLKQLFHSIVMDVVKVATSMKEQEGASFPSKVKNGKP